MTDKLFTQIIMKRLCAMTIFGFIISFILIIIAIILFWQPGGDFGGYLTLFTGLLTMMGIGLMWNLRTLPASEDSWLEQDCIC